MSSNRPTHGYPLSEEEIRFKRGAEAGVKSWQGGPRFAWAGRGGLYSARTGNTHGGKKVRNKTGPKPSRTTERHVTRPHWAQKYITERTANG